jgi:hypothetical protein
MVCERLLGERQLVFFGFLGGREQERDENGRGEKRGRGCETRGRAGKGIERRRVWIVELGLVGIGFFEFGVFPFRLVRNGSELREAAS